MEREKVKALLESGVLQAYAEGKTIQVWSPLFLGQGEGAALGCWADGGAPLSFSRPSGDYRVKQEPKFDWVVIYPDRSSRVVRNCTEEFARSHTCSPYELRKLCPKGE